MNNNEIIEIAKSLIEQYTNKASKETNSALKEILTFKAEGLKKLIKEIKEHNENEEINKSCLISIYGELLHPSRISSYQGKETNQKGQNITSYNYMLFDMEESHNKKAFELYKKGL